MSDESIVYINGTVHIVDDEWGTSNEEKTFPIHAEGVVTDGAFTTELLNEKWPFGGEIRVELKITLKRSQGKVRAELKAFLYEGDSETTSDLDDQAHFEITIPSVGTEKKFTLTNSGSGDMAEFDLIFTWKQAGQGLSVAPQVAGVWRAGAATQQVVYGEQWSAFVAKWASLSSTGLRLVDVESWGSGSDRAWTGVFRPASGGYAFWASDWLTFVKKDKELSQNGVYLIDLTTYVEEGARVWAGVWKGGAKKPKLITGLDWATFTTIWQQLASEGLRLIDVQSYVESGARKWAGLFRPGSGGYALYGAEWPAFTAKWNELAGVGLRLVDISTYQEGGKRLWVGVWAPGNDGYALWAGSQPQFQEQVDKLAAKGLRLVDIELF